MRPEPIYPSAPSSRTFQDGLEFQDWVVDRLARQGLILQNFSSRRYQIEVGENLQGFEIKLDRRCTDTGRLSIEIAEKADASNEHWVPSGIFRDDNSWLYIQGNRTVLYIFGKRWLQRYFNQCVDPRSIDESLGTVRKFYLPLEFAKQHALKVIA